MADKQTAVIYLGPTAASDGTDTFIVGDRSLPKGVAVVIETKKELAQIESAFESASRYHEYEVDEDYREPEVVTARTEYEEQLKNQLVEEAQDRGLDLPSDANKEEIIDALVADDAAQEPEVTEEPGLASGDVTPHPGETVGVDSGVPEPEPSDSDENE